MKTKEHILYRPLKEVRGFVFAYHKTSRRVIGLAEDAGQAEVDKIVKWARRKRGRVVFDVYLKGRHSVN